MNLTVDVSRISINLSENFRSTLFKSASQSIRDEQYFILTSKYKISDSYRTGISANSSILSDDRNTLLNKTTINYLTIFGEIKISNDILISPFGGFSENKQVGQIDKGPVYGVEGSLQNLEEPDFSINSNLKFQNEDILPRRNLLRFINISITNTFNESVTNLIRGRFFRIRKDFYLPADSIISQTFSVVNNIESRTESNYIAEEKLQYDKIVDNVNMEIAGSINYKTIEREKRYKTNEVLSESQFDTNVDELFLSVGSALYYNTSFFNGTFNFNLVERDEKHIIKNFKGSNEVLFNNQSELESRKNNNSRRATLAFSGDFNFSKTDKLTLSLYHNKLQYDTPSKDNDDDRDEILSIIRLKYSKNLSPFFEAFINADATISHVVYLFASRSSNNNINRVLRFATGGFYKGANLTSLNTFAVSANYTVYDFEDISSSLRSISFRQFTGTDSSQINLSKRFAFVITGYLKLSEQADLNWKEFSERPTRYLREIYTDPMLVLKYKEMRVGIGVRYFSLSTIRYDKTTRVPDTEYLSVGPLAELIYKQNDSLYLKINGWYEFISVNHISDKERVNFIMDMNWNF